MKMANKGRLSNIEDPTLAIIGAGTVKEEEKSNAPKTAPKKTETKSKTSTPAKPKPVAPVKEPEKTKPATPAVPELLKRPEKERLTKRFMILLPESLYIRLYNASVESDKSLNKYILDVLKDHAENNNI